MESPTVNVVPFFHSPGDLIGWFIFRWIWCNGILNVVAIVVAIGVVIVVNPTVVLALGGGVLTIIVCINWLLFCFFVSNLIIVGGEKSLFLLYLLVKCVRFLGHWQYESQIFLIMVNDTHMEELVLYGKIHWDIRLAASDVFHLFTYRLSSFNFMIAQMSEKRDSSSI